MAALVGEQFPQWQDEPIRRLDAGGTDNVMVRLGEQHVIRLPRTPRAEPGLERELSWLPRLGPPLPLEIPEVLHVSRRTGRAGFARPAGVAECSSAIDQ